MKGIYIAIFVLLISVPSILTQNLENSSENL